MADQLGRPLGSIGPITPDMACYQRMRSVIAVHPLTGESLWTRSDTEPGSDIFGDDEMLFIVASQQRRRPGRASARRLRTGPAQGSRLRRSVCSRWDDAS